MVYTSYLNLGERLAPAMTVLAPIFSLIALLSRVSPRLGDAVRERVILLTLGFLGSDARKRKMSSTEAIHQMARMTKELADIEARRTARAAA